MTGRVLVTGAGGQVGRELQRALWPTDVEVQGFDSARLDITDEVAVAEAVEQVKPKVIVNAAAYTAVDLAEDEAERAFAVNGTGVGHLAQAADRAGAMLVHLSTDYVFDGTKQGWYVEADPISPLGVYGESKAAGEAAAAKADRVVVLRTSWVFGALGSNFVTTMLRLADERDEIGVVADQFGCPTAAGDLARAIVELVEATGAEPPSHRLYHLAGPTDLNWYDFAQRIFALSVRGFVGECRPLTTSEYPTKAARPANSRLDSSLIATELDIRLPPLDQSLVDVVTELEAAAVPSTDRDGAIP